LAAREKVFVARVRGYEDTAAIAAAVRRGLDFLGWKPPARLVGKANWVLAHEAVARSCYTRPEFLKGALTAILERNDAASIDLIGNSGAGVPTRVVARRAAGNAPEFLARGAYELERIFNGRVKIRPTDGERLVRYKLSVGDRLERGERRAIDRGEAESTSIDLTKRYWREVTTSEALLEAEAFVLFPKLKSNVLSHGLTGAVKLQGIGLLLDEARMVGHNYHNHRRMVDMLEVAEPDLVVTDGIEMALGGNQMTERGHPLGVIVMATNAVAHDAVVARILNLRPEEIEHLKVASERAYGPLWADEIEIGGDVKIGELNARVRSFGENGFIPVTEFPAKFERETRLKFPMEVLGEPPWDVAGVHGLVLDWLYMTYDFRERRKLMSEWPPATIIVGGFAERPPEPAHDRVFVIGDLAIEAWRRLGWGGLGLTIPRFLQARLHGPSRVERFTRPDGRKGTAWLLPGEPPTHRDMIIGMAIATRLRVRPPLMRLDLVLDSYVRMLVTSVGRLIRNPLGPREALASSIARLQERKAARRALLDGRRAAGGDTLLETPSWAPPKASPSQTPSGRTLPEGATATERFAAEETYKAPPRPPAGSLEGAPPPPPTPSMVVMAGLDTQDEIQAPKPTGHAIPAATPSMVAIAALETQDEIPVAKPTGAAILAPTPAMIECAGEQTSRIEVDPLGIGPVHAGVSAALLDPGLVTTKLDAREIAETAARSAASPRPGPLEAAPALPPPPDPKHASARNVAPVDFAGFAPASGGSLPAAILTPSEAPAASPHEATGRFARADVEAAVKAATEAAAEPPAKPPPQSKKKGGREKVAAKGGGKGKGKKRK